MGTRSRIFSACAAVIGWLALILQLCLTMQQVIDRGGSAASALWLWIGYFTITTNLLAAAVLSASALGPVGRISRFLGAPGIQSMTAMSIVIVGLIYNLILRGLWQPQGWSFVADVMLHDVMPLLFLLHWWCDVPKAALRVRQIGRWQLYPAGYLIYALLRGALDGWYPYPFIDVTTLGYTRALINAAFVLLAFLALAWALVMLGHWQTRRAQRLGTGNGGRGT